MKPTVHVALTLLAIATTAGLLAAAGPPLVALRVELEPLGARDDATAVEVVVQVAPEDRPRVGPSAWVELELRRGRDSVDRVARAVEVDGQGAARVDVVWPPGAYDLHVEIRSARGDASGRWSDRVTVPALERTLQPVDAPAPPPQPAPTPAPEPTPSPRAETGAPASAPPPPAEVHVVAPVELVETTAVQTVAAPEPAAVAAPTPEPPAAATVAPPPAPLSTPEPPAATAETVSLTALVTRMQRPVPSLGRETLSLKAAGRPVPILAVAGPGVEPLSLALAVDLSATMASHLPELRRHLGQLALQVTASGGSVSLVVGLEPPRRAAEWGARPDEVIEALQTAGGEPRGNLAGMVGSALAGLTDRPGRRLALVVTDGGDTADRDDWRSAEEAAVAAAAPLLVVALPGLEGRPEAALDRLVASCGGERFAASTDELTGTVLRHFGDLLEATWAVRFERPADADVGPFKVKLTTADPALEVRHPNRVK